MWLELTFIRAHSTEGKWRVARPAYNCKLLIEVNPWFIPQMSNVIEARCAVSGYEYCCHVHWSVCLWVCVCVWPGPNGKTTAHQLLFGWRSSGTMSVIRQRYTHTHTCKNPHFLVKSKKKIEGDIYWLMMSPEGNVLEGYHAGILGTGRLFLHLFLHSAPCKIPTNGWIFHKVHSGTIMHSAKCSLKLIIPLLCLLENNRQLSCCVQALQ